MKGSICPHCNVPYLYKLIDGKYMTYCPKCYTYLDAYNYTYNYTKESPQYIKDSFKALELIRKSSTAVVMSDYKVFDTNFSLKSVRVFHADTEKPKLIELFKDLDLSKSHIIGWNRSFAFAALDIAKECLENNMKIHSFMYPEGHSINQLLYIPMLSKVLSQGKTYSKSVVNAVERYYRITIEGKLRNMSTVFKTGDLPVMSDEYLLLSNELLDPSAVIGVVSLPSEVDTNVKNYIKQMVHITDVKKETIPVPLKSKKLREFRTKYLSALPSVAVNKDVNKIPGFDILTRSVLTFEYTPDAPTPPVLIMDYLYLINHLCEHYMGSELTDYGVRAKKEILQKAGREIPDNTEEIILTFWRYVDEVINSENKK